MQVEYQNHRNMGNKVNWSEGYRTITLEELAACPYTLKILKI